MPFLFVVYKPRGALAAFSARGGGTGRWERVYRFGVFRACVLAEVVSFGPRRSVRGNVESV